MNFRVKVVYNDTEVRDVISHDFNEAALRIAGDKNDEKYLEAVTRHEPGVASFLASTNHKTVKLPTRLRSDNSKIEALVNGFNGGVLVESHDNCLYAYRLCQTRVMTSSSTSSTLGKKLTRCTRHNDVSAELVCEKIFPLRHHVTGDVITSAPVELVVGRSDLLRIRLEPMTMIPNLNSYYDFLNRKNAENVPLSRSPWQHDSCEKFIGHLNTGEVGHPGPHYQPSRVRTSSSGLH